MESFRTHNQVAGLSESPVYFPNFSVRKQFLNQTGLGERQRREDQLLYLHGPRKCG